MFYLLLFLFVLNVTGQEIPGKLYSFTCLAAERDLCIGVSPGKKQVTEDLEAQVKNKSSNVLQGLDDEKMRSDFTYGTTNGTLKYSKDPTFCLQRIQKTNRIFLKRGGCNTPLAFWNTTRFLDNQLQVSALQHVASGLCATVMRCDLIINEKLKIEYCDKKVNEPAKSLDQIQKSAMVRLWTCWFAPKGNKANRIAQTWRQREDCVPGCDAVLQDNTVCDPVCNTEACNMDNGYCNSKSPTPPTRSPTFSPSINPTNNPSTNPSINPTSSPSVNPSVQPTTNPSINPTKSPSNNPSRIPSNNPSNKPTLIPSFAPTTKRPSTNPTRNPSFSPTKSPTSQVGTMFPWWWILLGILLLLCCCFCIPVYCIPVYYRGLKQAPPPDEEEVIRVIKRDPTPKSTPPRDPTPIMEEALIKEVELEEFELPPPAIQPRRTIRKEVDPNNNNYVKEKVGRTISFRKNGNEYQETEIPAENLDKVVNELKNTIKKT
jgi:hypothetical protein